MKIGLLTIHHAYNFGAMLQAYATYKVLSDMGHDVELIDYDNENFAGERALMLPNNSFGNIFRNLRSMLHYKQLKKRAMKYEEFYKKMQVSDQCYDSTNLGKVSGYDVVVTGSDQTFSLYLTGNKKDVEPFFQKDIKNTKKISFASSMGEKFYRLTTEDKEWMKERFNEFYALSVREESSADYIEKLAGKRPTVVLDPTLLRDEDEWIQDAVETEYVKVEYIAFYTVLSAPWVIKYVEEIAAKTGLKVIAMHPRTRFEISAKFNYVGDLGPGEFLSVIKNAKYVITTSFHASVFSIIFKKQFVSLKLGEGNRLTSLLNTLNLNKQLVSEKDELNCTLLENKIDYTDPYKSLHKEQEYSLNYLKQAINRYGKY